MTKPELTVLDGELYIRAEALGPFMQLEEVQWTCLACPLQFIGQARGLDGNTRPVYFRLRHGHWRLEYADDETEIASGDGGTNDGAAEFAWVQRTFLRHNVHLPDSQNWAGAPA